MAGPAKTRSLLKEIEAIILDVVSERGSCQGYNVYHEAERKLGKSLSISSVYETLHRLESSGYLATTSGGTHKKAGSSRRYYQVTQKGKNALRDYVKHAEHVLSILGKKKFRHEGGRKPRSGGLTEREQVILDVVRDKSSHYAYEIRDEMATRGKITDNSIRTGSLYKALHRLEAAGYLSSYGEAHPPLGRPARRYHWLSDNLVSFVEEPHSAIASDQKGRVLNMVAKKSNKSQVINSKLAGEKPEKTVKQFKKIIELNLPAREEVEIGEIKPENLNKILLSTYEQQPKDFEQLLAIKGVGPKTIRALSLISELIYNAPASREDPAKFSFAHGGKDGTPYPVDKKTYDKSIEILKFAVEKAKIGDREKIEAIKRLQHSLF